MKSVYIATPMYGGKCYQGYVNSLIENILDLKEHGYFVQWHFIGNESLITRGRNLMVDAFLKSECTHLMFIDSDIVFPVGSIRKMLETNKELVCVPYPKKGIDWDRINKTILENLDDIKNGKEIDLKMYGAAYVMNFLNLYQEDEFMKEMSNEDNELLEIRHGGTGFMLISRNVFTKLKPHMKQARGADVGKNKHWYTEYFKTGIDNNGIFQSEDWLFCDQWRGIGGKVFLVNGIKLDHIGTYIYSGDWVKFGANIQ